MLQRRVLQFAAVILLTGLLVPMGQAGGGKDKGTDKGKDGHHHEMFDKCAKACNDCQRICDACTHHCAHMVSQGKKEHMKTLRSCQDCATVCAAAAQIVARGGPFSDTICKACADVCKRCGDACDKVGEDKMMKQCADECHRCEKACQEMVKHVGHMLDKTGTGKDAGESKEKVDKE